ncbi:MAG: right-handed parallel beta-helix repeat-containing protein [Candidatus Bathyarchaeota archaeon]|nr:right-handed parallel beta-helix repeat-containing protein [Candidatus Bathyarchaeota archaeon]
MFRKVLTIGFVMLFLGAIGSAFFKVNMLAYAAGTIYIRANGLVEGTDKITNEKNVTYTFTDDINDSIVVERSNIIINGDGYTLTGPYTEIGFNLTDLTNVTIRNVNIVGFGYGIYLQSSTLNIISDNNITFNEGNIYLGNSSENTISGNTITDGAEAIQLYASSSNTILDNSMTHNYRGLWLRYGSAENVIHENNITASSEAGIYLDGSSGNIIMGNNITDSDDYGIYLINNCAGNTISGNNIKGTINVAGIYLNGSPNNVISGNNIKDSPNEHISLLHSSDNNSIFGNNLTNSTADVGIYVYACSLNSFFGNNITENANSGIRIDSSSDSTIYENNISENLNGIYLWYSSNITVSGNSITTNNQSGIILDNSGNNIVNGNNITANKWWGVNPAYSNNNTVSGNNIKNNNVGFNSASSDFNIVSANNIIDNVYSGVYLESSSNNTFQHNNLINNTNQVVVELSYANNWDDGYPSGGNYWSNYTGVDLDHDGIGDTEHIIDANNTDRHPLMGMYYCFNTSLGIFIDIISNSTIEDFEYFEFNSTIIMHVYNTTTIQTHGFCRIRIPHALMNETYNVTINGAEPYYVNYTLYDDGDNRWIYFSYQHSTLEIVIIPEFPTWTSMLLILIVPTVAIAIYKQRLRKTPKC